MKKLKDIKERLDVIYAGYNPILMTNKEVKQLSKEALLLEVVKKYLETNPNEEFVISDLQVHKNKLLKVSQRYNEWLAHTPKVRELKNPQAKFNKDLGITDMRSKIKMLEFILA